MIDKVILVVHYRVVGSFKRKNVITLVIIVILLLAIPLLLRLVQEQQKLKSKAASGPIVFQGFNVRELNGRQVFKLDDQGQPTVGLTLTSPFGPGSDSIPFETSAPNSQTQNKISWITNDISIQADDFYMILNGQKFTGDGIVQLDSAQGAMGFGTNMLLFAAIWPAYENGLLLVIVPTADDTWGIPLLATTNDQNGGNLVHYNNPIMNYSSSLPKIGSPYTINELLELGTNDNNDTGTLYFRNLKITPFFNPTTRNNTRNIPSALQLQDTNFQTLIENSN